MHLCPYHPGRLHGPKCVEPSRTMRFTTECMLSPALRLGRKHVQALKFRKPSPQLLTCRSSVSSTSDRNQPPLSDALKLDGKVREAPIPFRPVTECLCLCDRRNLDSNSRCSVEKVEVVRCRRCTVDIPRNNLPRCGAVDGTNCLGSTKFAIIERRVSFGHTAMYQTVL